MCYFSLPNMAWSLLTKVWQILKRFAETTLPKSSIRAEDLAEYYFILHFKKRDNSYFYSFKKNLIILILYVFFSKDTEPHMFP